MRAVLTFIIVYFYTSSSLVGCTLSKTDAKKSSKPQDIEVSFPATDETWIECVFVCVLLSFCLSLSNSVVMGFVSQTSVADRPVHERGLIVTDPQWRDIVKEERRFCPQAVSKRQFQGSVLGYITPVS